MRSNQLNKSNNLAKKASGKSTRSSSSKTSEVSEQPRANLAGFSGELENLEKVIELMEKYEVAELEWERKGERLKLRTNFAISGRPIGLGEGQGSDIERVPPGVSHARSQGFPQNLTPSFSGVASVSPQAGLGSPHLTDSSYSGFSQSNSNGQNYSEGHSSAQSMNHSGQQMSNGSASLSNSPGKEGSSSRSTEPKAEQKQVASPFVGTFYRSASPESQPYVNEGQIVKRGDVLCIIEAMKLMNEIEAEIPGKIVSILAENGQPVEYGEPLFVIEP